MSTNPNRKPIRGVTLARVIDALRNELGQKQAKLLERYDILHRMPIGMELDYLLAVDEWQRLPWWKRWTTPRPERPDLTEVDRALEAWDAKHLRQPCSATHPTNDLPCVLLENHAMPHQARSKVTGDIVEWEDEEADAA